MKTLDLPESFEDVKRLLAERYQESVSGRLVELVEPLVEPERSVAEIVTKARGQGKALLIVGRPGTGKSTFVNSLTWRTAVPIGEVRSVNANSVADRNGRLNGVIDELATIGEETKAYTSRVAVVLDYLESLAGSSLAEREEFFRRLNGLFRTYRLFVLWPITDEKIATDIIRLAARVSNTCFVRGSEKLAFQGPSSDTFVKIAKRTISVMYDGATLTDFSLTDADLTEVYEEVVTRPGEPPNIRDYLMALQDHWNDTSGYIESIRNQIPKPTEIWFVFAHLEAETVAGSFAQKSESS